MVTATFINEISDFSKATYLTPLYRKKRVEQNERLKTSTLKSLHQAITYTLTDKQR